jgi:hypothetical protein
MKQYVIIDKAAKYCPYIAVIYPMGSNNPTSVGVDQIHKAKFWTIGENLNDESDDMLNFFKKNKQAGQNWEIREVTFLVGPPLTLPW